MSGRFGRESLPDAASYYQSEGFAIRGRDDWQSGLCPFHAERSPSFRLNVRDGGYYCHGCEAKGGDVLAFHRQRYGLAFVDAARDLGAWIEEVGGNTPAVMPKSKSRRPPETPTKMEGVSDATVADLTKLGRAATIWNDSNSIVTSPVAEYLFGRVETLPPVDTDVRYHPNCEQFGHSGPAMISRISMATDCRIGIGVQVTWLRKGGRSWARGERRYIGKKAGGVVRLWPDEAVTHGLAIAEGIETTLAAAHLQRPIWAVLDAGNMAKFPVIGGIDCLTIFADNDESGTGQLAAAECADRWLDAGREVRILMSDQVGHDVADEVAAWA